MNRGTHMLKDGIPTDRHHFFLWHEAMFLTTHSETNELRIDRIARKCERLRTLLNMGGTMENHGISLHLADLRMNVRSIADMDESVWRVAARNIIESLSADRRSEAAHMHEAVHHA